MMYKIKINGYNFLMNESLEDTKPKKLGFFATRIINAENENTAIQNAIDMIQHDPSILNKIANSENDMPSMKIEEIKFISLGEISELDIDYINRTYMFYPDDDIE